MKKLRSKISKKNRNIISGIGVCIAAVFAVARFFDVPQSEINTFFLTTLLFVVGIISLAVFTVVSIKLLGRIKNSLFKSK